MWTIKDLICGLFMTGVVMIWLWFVITCSNTVGFREAERQHRVPSYPIVSIKPTKDHDSIYKDRRGYYWVEDKTPYGILSTCNKCHGEDTWNNGEGYIGLTRLEFFNRKNDKLFDGPYTKKNGIKHNEVGF